jgi:hypothetical protein
MSSLAPEQWFRTRAGVVGALLAGMLLAPSPLRASCGDYVLVNHPGAGRHGADASHVLPGTSSLAAPSGPGAPMPHPRRCSGPMCSGQPSSLPLDQTPSSPPRAGQSGCWIPLPPFAAPDSFAHHLDDGTLQPIRRAAPVYHPPRSLPAGLHL